MQASLLKNIVDFSRSLLGNKGEIFFVCSYHVSENIVDFSGSLLGKKGGVFLFVAIMFLWNGFYPGLISSHESGTLHSLLFTKEQMK